MAIKCTECGSSLDPAQFHHYEFPDGIGQVDGCEHCDVKKENEDIFDDYDYRMD